MKFCNQDISKTITASLVKIIFFFSYYLLKIWTLKSLKTCNKDILKTITARSLKFGQVIENDE